MGPDAVIVSLRKIKDSEGKLWVEATASPREGSASDAVVFPATSTSVLKRKRPLMIGGLITLFAFVVAAVVIFWPRSEAIPTLEEKRIVVLPFENLGPAEDTYFAEGITDEITARLSRIEGFGVIGRTSAYQYKSTDKTFTQIGDELGVDYALEGTIRWQRLADGPGQVRITPQLIRISDSTHVWAHVYDEDLTDIFKVQSSIAEQVAEAMDITLLESERQALKVKPTNNLEAYDYFLLGNDYSRRSVEERELNDIQIAVQMYEKAIDLDPTFAHAYARLSHAHSRMYWFYVDHTKERQVKAKQAVDTAFQLRPDMPEAHWAMGYYYFLGFRDYDSALRHFSIAKESMGDGNGLVTAIGSVQRSQGKIEQALAAFRKAYELDPRSSSRAREVAQTYRLLRSFPEAMLYIDHAISLAPDRISNYIAKAHLYVMWQGSTEKARKVFKDLPKFVSSSGEPPPWYERVLDELDGNYLEALEWALSQSWVTYNSYYNFFPVELLRAEIYRRMNQPELAKAHYDSARRILETHIQEQPEDARAHGALGIVYAGLGRKEEAIREGQLAVKLLPISKDFLIGQERLRELTVIYTKVGEYDLAIDQLEYLLSIPGELSIPSLRIFPDWDPLREHPRFQKLLEGGK